MMGVWNARLLDDSLHKALYGRGKALYQSTHHYKDFGLLVGDVRVPDLAVFNPVNVDHCSSLTPWGVAPILPSTMTSDKLHAGRLEVHRSRQRDKWSLARGIAYANHTPYF